MKVIEGRITSEFGYRVHPVTGARKLHNGTDVAAAVGTPVLSPCDGEVMEVYRHQSGGKTVIVGDRVGNRRFGFCHLNGFCVRVGDRVVAGQVIAKSGNTGVGTGPHLHYTVKTGGCWTGRVYVGGDFVDSKGFINF